MVARLPASAFRHLPRLFKGAAPGSFWAQQFLANARTLPKGIYSPRQVPSVSTNHIVTHITQFSGNSPLTSVTMSYAIALAYAKPGATQKAPGFIFEIDAHLIPPRASVQLFDPIGAISSAGIAHRHQGDQRLISMLAHQRRSLPQVPKPGGGFQTPVFTDDFRAIVFASRDAELLVDRIPPSCIIHTHYVTV